MTYTSHGHHIEGTPRDPISSRPSFVDCLGPRVCIMCYRETINIVRPVENSIFEEVSR